MSRNDKTIRIFMNAWFRRFARRERIQNKTLLDTVALAEEGIIDADLGGNIIKQRIARQGQGKSSGYRSIVVFKKRERAFFVYGFAKSDLGNIDKKEVETFKKAAKELLSLSDEQLQNLIKNRALVELKKL